VCQHTRPRVYLTFKYNSHWRATRLPGHCGEPGCVLQVASRMSPSKCLRGLNIILSAIPGRLGKYHTLVNGEPAARKTIPASRRIFFVTCTSGGFLGNWWNHTSYPVGVRQKRSKTRHMARQEDTPPPILRLTGKSRIKGGKYFFK